MSENYVSKFQVSLEDTPEKFALLAKVFEKHEQDVQNLAKAYGTLKNVSTAGVFDEDNKLSGLITKMTAYNETLKQTIQLEIERTNLSLKVNSGSDKASSGQLLVRKATASTATTEATDSETVRFEKRKQKALETVQAELQAGLDAERKLAESKQRRQRELEGRLKRQRAEQYSDDEMAIERSIRRQEERLARRAKKALEASQKELQSGLESQTKLEERERKRFEKAIQASQQEMQQGLDRQNRLEARERDRQRRILGEQQRARIMAHAAEDDLRERQEAEQLAALRVWANNRINRINEIARVQAQRDAEAAETARRSLIQQQIAAQTLHNQRVRHDENQARLATNNALIDNLNQGLGGPQNNHTVQGQLNIARANDQLRRFLDNAAFAPQRVREMFQAILTNNAAAIQGFNAQERELEIRLRSLQSAFAGASYQGGQFQRILISTQGVIRLVEVQFLHKAISNTMKAFAQSKDTYLELEKNIALINTISQKATRNTEAWTASLVNLSNSYGIDLLDAAAAAYEAVSNQIAQGVAITPFLAQSFEFARATSTTAKDSVNLLSSALNAYSLGVQSTERVSSILFKTIELGRVVASEMANTFGNTARLASTLGVTLEELGAGLSTLTIQGIKYDTSATLMNNIMLKLLKPTQAMKELFKEWGVVSGEAAVATFGFGGVLKRLNAEFNAGGLTRLGELEGDLRAIRAAAGLAAGGAFEKFDENLKNMTQSLGEYRTAVETTTNTLEFKLNVEMQKLNNAFVTVVGKRFNEGILDINTALGGLSNTFTQIGLGALNSAEVLVKFLKVGKEIITLYGAMDYQLTALMPTISAFFLSHQTFSPLINLVASRIQNYNAQMTSMNALAIANVPLMQRINIALFGTQIAAGGAATAMTALAAAQSAALLGIPLIIAGITYSYYSWAEAQRKLGIVGEETVQKYTASLSKASKEESFILDKQSKEFSESINNKSKELNRYIAVFRQGVASVNKDFVNIDNDINNKTYTDSLVGKDGLTKLSLINQRVQELAANTEKLTLGHQFEEAEKSLKTFMDLVTDFKKEQESIISDSEKKIAGLKAGKDEKVFDLSLSKMTDPAKINAITAKITTLRKEASELFNNKDFEAGNAKLEQASKLADKLGSLSDKKGSTLISAIVNDQIKMHEGIIAAAKAMKDAEAPDTFLGPIKEKIEAQKELNRLQSEAISQIKDLDRLQQAEIQKLDEAKKNAKTASVDVLGKLASLIANFDNLTMMQEFKFASVDPQALNNYLGKLQELKAYQLELQNEMDKGPGFSQSAASEIQAKIQAKAQEFRGMVAALQGKGLIDTDAKSGNQKLAAYLSDFAQSSNRANEANKLLMESEASVNRVQKSMQTMGDSLKAPLTEMSTLLGEKFPEIFKRVTDTVKAPVQELDTMINKLITNVNAISGSVVNNAGGGNALGGLMGFAGGGFLRGRVGRDNMLVRAHANEFMVNAEAAAKFTPQLVAMNSGYSGIQGFNNGGPITNVGGITINAEVNKGGTAQDVVSLGRALEREISRGTINLSPRRR